MESRVAVEADDAVDRHRQMVPGQEKIAPGDQDEKAGVKGRRAERAAGDFHRMGARRKGKGSAFDPAQLVMVVADGRLSARAVVQEYDVVLPGAGAEERFGIGPAGFRHHEVEPANVAGRFAFQPLPKRRRAG